MCEMYKYLQLHKCVTVWLHSILNVVNYSSQNIIKKSSQITQFPQNCHNVFHNIATFITELSSLSGDFVTNDTNFTNLSHRDIRKWSQCNVTIELQNGHKTSHSIYSDFTSTRRSQSYSGISHQHCDVTISVFY